MKGKSDSTPVDPDIEIGGLKIWIHGREFPNAQDYWDGNWLVATAEYGETSSFRVQGPILHLGEIAHLLRDCERLCLTLEGAAVLDCIEPYLFVELVAADGLGDVSATFSLSRDLKESQVYQENLNRTSVVRIVDACRRILNLYNVRGAIGAGASN